MSEDTSELVRLLGVNRLATEYWDGKWHWPSEAEPLAIVTFAQEPYRERRAGWNWWADGRMGWAESYEQAKSLAVELLRLRGKDRPHE